MKHVYYGINRMAMVYIDMFEIRHIETRLNFEYSSVFRNMYRREIESDIRRLKDGSTTRYAMKQYKEVDKEVFIAERNHDHVCDVGENIRINNHEGKINDRKYDAEKDTMYYYTNIILANKESDDNDKKLEQAREEILKALQKIMDYYFPEEESVPRGETPNQKKKSFWKRIFKIS